MLYQLLLTYKPIDFGEIMKNLTVLAALFAVGCVDIEDTGTPTTDTSDTEVVVADPSFLSQLGRQLCIFEHH